MPLRWIGVWLTLLVACDSTFGTVGTNQTAYLFSTFKEGAQDGLRFAYSYDGFHWSNIPGVFLKPAVGGKILRDPSIVRNVR